ncbi:MULTISPECIES: STAS domain-containing protein [Paenibacillus]|uniref:STAS domain-containing protein n=1 Tax=Paenibacillus TaxID=44249 RepID=UPI0022B93A53|nr:STAS domain-containing protein [Paenibacillus caseinilyticus]MCZ8519685.1 STAS domain-containing protein [Paenibacillus caseinilyticus]
MTADKFQVRTESGPQGSILYLTGELDLGTANQLRLAAEALALSPLPLKLNLRELTYIDSTGIGIVVSILKNRQTVQMNLIAAEVPAKIKRLFDMTGLSRFLEFEGVIR